MHRSFSEASKLAEFKENRQSKNLIRDALAADRFSHIIELVASRRVTEERLVEIGEELAAVPQVVACSITSYAGGSLGHDPIRLARAAKTRGFSPNVHITCVNRTPERIAEELDELAASNIENVFALTGDYPKTSAGTGQIESAMDSVQLTDMISAKRSQGFPFHIAVAVSPFKYTEADCVYQYLKLEKKIAAGADYAITQLGFDVEKFRELMRYLLERGLNVPVFGNVYVLNARAAEKMSHGEPPGCWVSPKLAEKVRQESESEDRGLHARLERAAGMVAILRGLGYAGAYIGGEHDPNRVRWIIERSEELKSTWEELAEEYTYSPSNPFYFFADATSSKSTRSVMPRAMDVLGHLLPVNKDGPLRNGITNLMKAIDNVPPAARALERLEFALKARVFGCQACGNCVLGQTEYVCPMTCPKNLRNGPCGGTSQGRCEVIPDQPCIWNEVYERAKAADRVDDLLTFIPAPNRELKGTSSWINYFLGRDSRPKNLATLVQVKPLPPGDALRRSEPSATQSAVGNDVPVKCKEVGK